MKTQKWHVRDHVVQSLRNASGIEYVHSNMFESSHQNYKNWYRKASHVKGSAIEEMKERWEVAFSQKEHSR